MHQSEGGDNTKKYAIVCAMVMLVSLVPAFAAGVDDQGNDQSKTQEKYQFGQQNNNSQDNGDQTKIQNKTKTKQQLKTCADCNKTGEKQLKQLKTQNRLKTQNCTV
jgi:hypothetical protein